MTTFVSPDAVTVIIERAKQEADENCTCRWVNVATANDEFDAEFEQCFPHMVVGLLQPTVTAYEPTL